MFQSTNPFNKEKKGLRCASYFPPRVSTGGNEQWGTRNLCTCFFFCLDYDLFVVPATLTTPNLDKVCLKDCHSLLTTQSANKASASWPLQTPRTRWNLPQEPELKRNGTFLLPKCRKKIYENAASSGICCQCRRDTLQVLVPLATDRYRELNQAPGS